MIFERPVLAIFHVDKMGQLTEFHYVFVQRILERLLLMSTTWMWEMQLLKTRYSSLSWSISNHIHVWIYQVHSSCVYLENHVVNIISNTIFLLDFNTETRASDLMWVLPPGWGKPRIDLDVHKWWSQYQWLNDLTLNLRA